MPNTNFQTIHQMGSAISNVVKQATGRDPVENIDMDYVTVAQNKTIGEMTISGNPASFHTGNAVPLQRLLIGIIPGQDLHGYNAPWPGGSGVNKIDVSSLVAQSETYGLTTSFDGEWIVISGTYTHTSSNPNFRIAKLAGGGVFPVTRFKAFSDADTAIHITQAPFGLADDNTTLTIMLSNMVQDETYNLRTKIVGYEGSTAPESYSPYSNICPITGRTGVNVIRTGTNIWDGIVETGTINNITGELVGHSTLKRSANIITVTAGVSYYFSTAKGMLVYWYDVNMNYLGYLDNVGTVNKIVTAPANATFMRIRLFSDYTDYTVGDISINYPSTLTGLYVYAGTTIPVNFRDPPGTVYRGTLDVISGVLTVDKAYALLDNPDRWSENVSGTVKFVYSILFNDRKKYSDSYTGLMCSYLPVNTATQQRTARWMGSTSSVFGLATGDIPDLTLEQVKADAQAGKISICYELAEPQIYQLTPQEVETLIGDNVVYTDGDTLEVMYYQYGEVI